MIGLLRLGEAESMPLIERRLVGSNPPGNFRDVHEICRLMVRFGESGAARVVTLLRTGSAHVVKISAAEALADVHTPDAEAAVREWRVTNRGGGPVMGADGFVPPTLRLGHPHERSSLDVARHS
jgi:hypothetical protein